MHLDIAVRKIPGPASGSYGARGLAGERAVSHALHIACNHKTPSDAVLHCRRFYQTSSAYYDSAHVMMRPEC